MIIIILLTIIIFIIIMIMVLLITITIILILILIIIIIVFWVRESMSLPSYHRLYQIKPDHKKNNPIQEGKFKRIFLNLISINLPTEGPKTPTKLHIKFGNTKYWVMLDTGCSNSLITERRAPWKRGTDKISWFYCKTNPKFTEFHKHIHKKRKDHILWHRAQWMECVRAHLIVVRNNHRAIIGRDLFQGQSSPLSNSEGKQISMLNNLDSHNLEQEMAKWFPVLIKRIGR